MNEHTANVRYYGEGLPSLPPGTPVPGRLIVIEGPDSVGRTILIDKLARELECRGHAVSSTGFRRSDLTREGMEAARQGTTFSPLTTALFYATDFADRLERQIVPSLKAGFWVLSDRYLFTMRARGVVRGADEDWLRRMYGYSLVPDLIVYLKADIQDLVQRTLAKKGFDYWESGMDLRLADNMYDSFVEYQSRLIEQFDRMADEYGFAVVDATQDAATVFQNVRALVLGLEGSKEDRTAVYDGHDPEEED